MPLPVPARSSSRLSAGVSSSKPCWRLISAGNDAVEVDEAGGPGPHPEHRPHGAVPTEATPTTRWCRSQRDGSPTCRPEQPGRFGVQHELVRAAVLGHLPWSRPPGPCVKKGRRRWPEPPPGSCRGAGVGRRRRPQQAVTGLERALNPCHVGQAPDRGGDGGPVRDLAHRVVLDDQVRGIGTGHEHWEDDWSDALRPPTPARHRRPGRPGVPAKGGRPSVGRSHPEPVPGDPEHRPMLHHLAHAVGVTLSHRVRDPPLASAGWRPLGVSAPPVPGFRRR